MAAFGLNGGANKSCCKIAFFIVLLIRFLAIKKTIFLFLLYNSAYCYVATLSNARMQRVGNFVQKWSSTCQIEESVVFINGRCD